MPLLRVLEQTERVKYVKGRGRFRFTHNLLLNHLSCVAESRLEISVVPLAVTCSGLDCTYYCFLL